MHVNNLLKIPSSGMNISVVEVNSCHDAPLAGLM